MTETMYLSTAKEILGYLRLSQDHWLYPPLQVNSPKHNWIFRGQGDASWPLIPKSLRDPAPPKAREKMSFPWLVLAREYGRVMSFLNLADELGISPIRKPDSLPFYKELQQAASGERRTAPRMSPALVEAFALAQHHGLPTRFLDWSASPLTALFFAARDAFDAKEERESFAVWAAPREMPGNSQIRVVSPPRTQNIFARHQLGYLTYDTEVDSHFSEEFGWPTQDEVLEKYKSEWGNGRWPVLRKITAPTSIAGEVLSLLFQEGVSQAHLMPTLDNVANTVQFLPEFDGHRLERLKQILVTQGIPSQT